MVMLMLTTITVTAQEIYTAEEKPTAVQLKTNGLYWLALSPNVGIEFQTDLGVAFLFDYVGAWWNSYDKNRFWSNYAFSIETRYYLGNISQISPYKGSHVGLYGTMATYDFEFGGKGYQSNDLSKTFTIGISYGFTKPLNRNFSIDFTVGIGYFQSTYDVYHPINGKYTRDTTKRLKFFGPTKLEATLVWNINNENK